MVTLFTDGSAVGGNPGSAGSSYLIMRGGDVLEGLGFPVGTAQSYDAELMAVCTGLEVCIEYLSPGEDVLVVSDCLNMIRKLATADTNTVTDPESVRPLWRRLYALLLKLNGMGGRLLTCWVKGHGSSQGNQICDRLANRAAVTRLMHRPVQGLTEDACRLIVKRLKRQRTRRRRRARDKEARMRACAASSAPSPCA